MVLTEQSTFVYYRPSKLIPRSPSNCIISKSRNDKNTKNEKAHFFSGIEIFLFFNFAANQCNSTCFPSKKNVKPWIFN